MKPLTATEIERRNKEYFDNPSPELQKVYDAFGKLQGSILLPLIDRAEQILKRTE